MHTSVPVGPSRGGGSVTRPLASRSISKELPWKKRDILRYSEPIGFRPLSARSMIDSFVSGVQIATQGSGVLARTVPFEKAVRNRVGMLSRFLESSECSKWPRNANGHVPARGTKVLGPEWRSGRSPATPVDCLTAPYPTFSHLATRFPTLPSDGPLSALHRALQGRMRPAPKGRPWPFLQFPLHR